MKAKADVVKRADLLRAIARAQAGARATAGAQSALGRRGEAAAWLWLAEWYEALAQMVREKGPLRQTRLF